jgi:asparagine synthase (glutamine-hydrolysing)
MSALAGRWNFNGNPEAAASCGRMLAAQQIYGPHDGAQWDDGDIALGRRLFRLLPEDAFDRQPLAGGGGRFRLVADLRLDNRDELARDMRLDPSAAKGLSDAAILLAAWERWQEAVFDHLFGDYAFALWDGRDRRLILARDPMGAKPLHYHLGSGFVAFASMPKGLHALDDVPYGPDEIRVAEHLALIPEYGPRSFFKDVNRVETGQVVIVKASGMTARRHWEPRRDILKLACADDYAEALRHHLDRAVEARLRGAGGQVASHLSAGLDSSAVAATAARLMAPAGGKVVAFTSVPREGYVGPDKGLWDEGPLAAATAALYPNMEHVLVRPDGRGTMERFDRDFYLCERPVLNICNMRWVDAINHEARGRGLRVLLTGDKGNFTISYDGIELLAELAARGRFLRLLREGHALVNAGRKRWRGVIASSIGAWTPIPVQNALRRLVGRKPLSLDGHSLLSRERWRALDIDGRARAQGVDLWYRPRKNGIESRLQSLWFADVGNYYKGALGGRGVDIRDATSDRKLVEFCLSVPMTEYLSNGQPRALAIRALGDRLPACVLAERRRGRQAIDWHEGLSATRDRLSEEIERIEGVAGAAATLDVARMRKLIDDWPTDGWHRPDTTMNYRWALIRGAVSGHFLRKASRSNA